MEIFWREFNLLLTPSRMYFVFKKCSLFGYEVFCMGGRYKGIGGTLAPICKIT